MLNGIEKKVLRKLGEVLLLRKEEIVELLKRETDNPEETFRLVIRSLSDKGFIRYVYAGSPCYAITQRGLQALSIE